MLVIDVQFARGSLPDISVVYAPGATVAFIQSSIRTIVCHTPAAFDQRHFGHVFSKWQPLRSAYE